MDSAARATDKRLDELEKKIEKVYKQSQDDLTKAWNKFMQEQGEKVKDLQSQYDAAKLSGDKDEIRKAGIKLSEAKRNLTLKDRYYKDMLDETTRKLADVNQTALKYVNDEMPWVYTTNYNEAKNTKGLGGYKFNMVDESTVKRLFMQDEIDLPNKALNIPKDMRWNAKQLNSAVLQGIVNGESMQKIADRIYPIVGNNEKAAIRNARTMVTGAQNRGRLDSYKKMDQDGIVQQKVWMATHDDRTRESHQWLDGEKVDLDKEFSNGLQCPGDENGPPEEVYNCRCTMATEIIGFRKADGRIEYVDIDRYEPDYFDKEEIEAKRAEREEKRAEQQAENVKAPYTGANLNQKIFDGLDDDTKQYLIDSLNNTDEDIRKLIEDTSNNLSVRWNDGEGTSCYWEDRGTIDMYLSKYGEMRDNEDIARTFWHEYGHYIDDARVSGSGYEVKVPVGDHFYTFEGVTSVAKEGNLTGGEYGDAAIKDINAFLDRYGLSDKYYVARTDEFSVPWMKYKESGASIDYKTMPFEDHRALSHALSEWSRDISGYTKANNYLYDMGYPKKPEYTDYMMPYRTPKRRTLKYKERFKGALDKYREDSIKTAKAQEAWEKSHDWDKLIKEQSVLYEEAKKKEKKLGPATDTFDGAAYGMFTSIASVGGHSHEYYCMGDKNVKEGVANVFGTMTLNDPDMVEAMEDLCPNIYSLLKGIIKK